MPKFKTSQVEVFRLDVERTLEDYAQRLKIGVARNRAMGMGAKGIRVMRESDRTRWAAGRAVLVRTVKTKVAGLVNTVHIAAYTKDLH